MNNSDQTFVDLLQARIINLEENQKNIKTSVKSHHNTLLKLTKNLNLPDKKTCHLEEITGEYSQYSQHNDFEEKINLLQTENNFLKENIEQNNCEIENYKKQIESLETTLNVIKQLLKYI